MTTVTVPVGKIRAVKPPKELATNALGSCVACVLYHPEAQVGGMAHVMLPTSDLYMMGDNPLKYADEAIFCLLQLLGDMGADKSGLQAWIVGGAMMVKAVEDIGLEVSESVKEQLRRFNIPLMGERIGGRVNRSARLDVSTGILWYTEASGLEKVL
jgi:chemotaxis protein CheD